MSAVYIDRLTRRDGTCKNCGRTATVFAVVLPDHVHAWYCEPCAAGAVDLP